MRVCRPQTRPHRRPFKGFGLPGSGIWRQLGTGHRSFTAAVICRGGVPDRAGQPEQNLAGIFRASRRRSWGLLPLRSFDPAWRSLAFPLSQPTCPQAAHLHRIFGGGSNAEFGYWGGVRAVMNGPGSWVFRLTSRASRPQSRAAAALGFSSSRCSGVCGAPAGSRHLGRPLAPGTASGSLPLVGLVGFRGPPALQRIFRVQRLDRS
jgi:hypothetical protein